MNEYVMKHKAYIKSHNSVKKIMDKYTISLILFILSAIIINLFLKDNNQVLALIKSLTISLIVTSILAYLINIFRHKNNFMLIYTEDNVHLLALIIGLFAIDINIYILIFAIVISLIIKNIFININISASLYGILVILLYKYFTGNLITPLTELHKSMYMLSYNEMIELGNGLSNYLFDFIYLSPILSIIAFIYLFHKKAIKYHLVFSYILTVLVLMIIIGLSKNFNIWFAFFQLITGNILFLTVYTLTDFKVSPTIKEGQRLYGIILGIITVILRLIIPEFAVIIAIILGSNFLVKPIEKLSPKLKYRKTR